MSRNRQNLPDPAAEDRICVRSLGLRLPKGHRVEPHAHDWHQLVYATEGVMSVDTARGTWVVPPHRAVWLPAGSEHQVRMAGVVRMQTVYIRPGLVPLLPEACCVIDVTPLLREIILEVMRIRMLRDDIGEHSRLAAVMADQIIHTRTTPLHIPYPSDRRALAVARAAQSDLSLNRPISDWVRGTGASVRTVERLFVQETGLTFGRWLQRVRVLHALERLALGDSVTAAGLAVGYESTSAFIAMFKKVLGSTPGSYFADVGGSSAGP